jgi:hypothetical protein
MQIEMLLATVNAAAIRGRGDGPTLLYRALRWCPATRRRFLEHGQRWIESAETAIMARDSEGRAT